ncbi:MAG: protein rep [Clostridia bacterium]|nr:protein rep [Clostridia bacterium]
MNLTARYIDHEYFEELRAHTSHNYQIADFYQDRYEAEGDDLYSNKSRAVGACAKFWDLEHYREQHVKDIKRVNLCRDKFCFNCQSMLAAKRYGKFVPILDSFKNRFKIVHVVFTVPNCEPEELKPLLDKMYRKFPFVLRYFKGAAKVHGVDFTKYGYGGAVRGLEVTYNKEAAQYHPHFHCMVLLSPKIDLRGKHTNAYSFDHNDPSQKHKFSDFEILLQKVWFLLLNDCKVTAEAIDGLKIGYDVQASDPRGNYHEVFKYACKGAFKESEGACIYQARVFWTLYGALKNRRMIQGYGALHNFNDLDGELLAEDAAAVYAAYIERLQRVEKPVFKVESLDDICERATNCKYISKNNFLRNVAEERRRGGENE